MANTITSLIPDVYSAMDIVSRELVGFIPSVSRDATVERAAVGQITRAFQTRAAVATNITPGVTPPNDGDQTLDNFNMTITKARRVPFRWNGEEARGLNNGGPGLRAIQIDQISQAIRTLTNEMEADVAALALSSSRAVGIPTTAPFPAGSSAGNDTALLRKVLQDNGTPFSDMHLVVSTGAGSNLRSLAQLQKQNETTGDFLRQGVLIDMNGFAIRESAATIRPAIGTSNNAGTTDAAGYAIGATVLTVAAAGTGTVLAGDIVTFAGDTNRYVVAPGGGVANLAAGGTLTIAKPGLRVAMSAATKTITVTAISTRNVGFRRSAFVLACRLPALVDGEDMAVERSLVQDPLSGIAFEIAKYQQYRQTQWEISAAWGVGAPKPEHAATLLGE